jgi:hypothetical protein
MGGAQKLLQQVRHANSRQCCLCPKYPDKNKRPPVSRWPSFCGLTSFLNVSINKKPDFDSQVVTYKKDNDSRFGLRYVEENNHMLALNLPLHIKMV